MIIDRHESIFDLKKIFSDVFSKTDPFDKLFVPSISKKILLYPTNGYYLGKEQFFALMRTLEEIGEKIFYLSEIEYNAFEKNIVSPNHVNQYLELSIDTPYHEYEKVSIISENALYSCKGKWGLIISHEDHAVIGANEEFIKIFKKKYPHWIDDQKKFLDAMKYWAKRSKADLTWVDSYMHYINE